MIGKEKIAVICGGWEGCGVELSMLMLGTIYDLMNSHHCVIIISGVLIRGYYALIR